MFVWRIKWIGNCRYNYQDVIPSKTHRISVFRCTYASPACVGIGINVIVTRHMHYTKFENFLRWAEYVWHWCILASVANTHTERMRERILKLCHMPHGYSCSMFIYGFRAMHRTFRSVPFAVHWKMKNENRWVECFVGKKNIVTAWQATTRLFHRPTSNLYRSNAGIFCHTRAHRTHTTYEKLWHTAGYRRHTTRKHTQRQPAKHNADK